MFPFSEPIQSFGKAQSGKRVPNNKLHLFGNTVVSPRSGVWDAAQDWNMDKVRGEGAADLPHLWQGALRAAQLRYVL